MNESTGSYSADAQHKAEVMWAGAEGAQHRTEVKRARAEDTQHRTEVKRTRAEIERVAEDAQHRTEVAQARAAIEQAIATLTTHKINLTEGQEKAIKRILYGVPTPQPQNGGC